MLDQRAQREAESGTTLTALQVVECGWNGPGLVEVYGTIAAGIAGDRGRSGAKARAWALRSRQLYVRIRNLTVLVPLNSRQRNNHADFQKP